MLVKNVMTKDFVFLRSEDTYQDAVVLLYKNNLTGCIVLDKDEKLVGYVSEKDLFRILYPYYDSYYKHPEIYTDGEKREEKAKEIRYHKVEVFMNKFPLTVSPEMPIMNAGALMLANRVHQFPVVENNRVVGLISRNLIYSRVFKKNFSDLL